LSHPSDGPRVKIQRAKKHIYELDAEIGAFLKSNPYLIFQEIQPDTGRKVWHVQVRRQPPPRLSAITGDAVHNLRSALDLLVNQLVLAPSEPSDKTAFPIGWDLADYEAKVPRYTKGVSDTAKAMIANLKPYKGGNDSLWRLHRLDIADKHRLLIPVGAAHGSVILPIWTPEPGVEDPFGGMKFGINPSDRKFPLKDRDEVFAAPSDFHDDVEITVDIALNEPGIIEGGAVLPALHELADLVKGIVAAFDPLLS
jgi:hypothetical protein